MIIIMNATLTQITIWRLAIKTFFLLRKAMHFGKYAESLQAELNVDVFSKFQKTIFDGFTILTDSSCRCACTILSITYKNSFLLTGTTATFKIFPSRSSVKSMEHNAL